MLPDASPSYAPVVLETDFPQPSEGCPLQNPRNLTAAIAIPSNDSKANIAGFPQATINEPAARPITASKAKRPRPKAQDKANPPATHFQTNQTDFPDSRRFSSIITPKIIKNTTGKNDIANISTPSRPLSFAAVRIPSTARKQGNITKMESTSQAPDLFRNANIKTTKTRKTKIIRSTFHKGIIQAP